MNENTVSVVFSQKTIKRVSCKTLEKVYCPENNSFFNVLVIIDISESWWSQLPHLLWDACRTPPPRSTENGTRSSWKLLLSQSSKFVYATYPSHTLCYLLYLIFTGKKMDRVLFKVRIFGVDFSSDIRFPSRINENVVLVTF